MGLISPSWAPQATDTASVGGKASSLFNLIELGARVPPFFVLTADAYRAHGDATLSPSARGQVEAALAHLGEDGIFAVRSSGIAEDSADNSFAGVFDTVLDVRGADAVAAAIETCWQSHRSARAEAYRAHRGIEDDPAMAVVVQQMVPAVWSGVCFTADPISQALSVVVVNAIAGVGESLVSGLVNPEEIRVDSASGVVLERTTPAGAEPLPDALLKDVVARSVEIADAAGFPQDLEWASDGRSLFLLQSRPITTIAGVHHDAVLETAERRLLDDPARIWTRAYADEVWTPPVSPLFYDVHNLTHHLRTRIANDDGRPPLPDSIFKYYRAAPYADVAVLERVYRNLLPVARRPSLLGQLPASLRAAVAAAPLRIRPILRRIGIFELRNRARWSLARNHRFLEAHWATFIAEADRLADVDLSALEDADVDRHIEAVWGLALIVGVECEIAVLYHAHDLKLILSGLLDRWIGSGDELYAAVSSGLPNSQTVRESDEIWLLAQAIRAAGPEFLAAAANSSWSEFRGHDDSTTKAITATFDAFLRRHRHRGANYKDLIYPRWGDDPELLWAQIKPLLEMDAPRPRDLNARAAAAREAAKQATRGHVTGWRALYRRPLLGWLLRTNEIYSAIRDNHRFYYDHVWFLLRRAYLEKGTRLADRGRIDHAEDVFYLDRREIEALLDGSLSQDVAAARIASRREEWRETQRNQPPKFLRAGYAPFADESPSESADLLSGLAASPGDVTGPARVAHEIADLAQLKEGEILVTRQTDPGWSPAFARISGLVLETGGTLAHGASLCREFGLPCVTAVERAASLINDGDLLSVSGAQGTVHIIERAGTNQIAA
jgi:pyruvate,water dikinase